MKLNLNTLKVLLTLVIIVGAFFWAGDSIRNRSYVGTDLNFPAGQSVVTVTNPSAAPVSFQLVGAGTRAFSVVSNIEGITGAAVRQGSGNTSTYSLDFALLPGVNEFTVIRGANVNFVSSTITKLDALVELLDVGSVRTTLIATGFFILGALYYISRTTGYGLSRILKPQSLSAPTLQPAIENAVLN